MDYILQNVTSQLTSPILSESILFVLIPYNKGACMDSTFGIRVKSVQVKKDVVLIVFTTTHPSTELGGERLAGRIAREGALPGSTKVKQSQGQVKTISCLVDSRVYAAWYDGAKTLSRRVNAQFERMTKNQLRPLIDLGVATEDLPGIDSESLPVGERKPGHIIPGFRRQGLGDFR